MAAEHRRNPDDHHDHSRSLPETERRTRDEEAEDGGGSAGSPSLPEAERRARENEARED